MIIGLTGRMASGKGEVIKILSEHGFNHITLSSMIREEAKKLGIEESRENLMKIGNEIREKNGAGILAKKALEKIKLSDKKNWIIDGIRNPAEIIELRKIDGVKIVAITASMDSLIERILSRSREGDAISKEEIIDKLNREFKEAGKDDGQQVGKCLEMADIEIVNEGSIEDLKRSVLQLI